jgi:hypothetical protein
MIPVPKAGNPPLAVTFSLGWVELLLFARSPVLLFITVIVMRYVSNRIRYLVKSRRLVRTNRIKYRHLGFDILSKADV